jgi:GT2 family glycosyltransferase
MVAQGKHIVVVVVAYNGMAWADRCFGSLRASSHPVQVMVIDNGSTDGTPDHIRKVYPEVELFRSDTNLGFGQANNKGMRWALDNGADHVFLLNQDAWVLPDTIRKLVDAAGSQPAYGILSPLQMNGAGSALDNNFAHFISDDRCPGLLTDLSAASCGDRIYEARFVNAAAWLITRECLMTIGGFDPSFFHYTEDNNYVDRLHYHGLKLGVLPSAIIHHDRDQRTAAPESQWQRTYRARKLRQRHADPALDLDPAIERKRLWKELLLAVISLRKDDALVARDHLKVLAAAVPPSVLVNRAISKQRGPSFL